MFGGGVENGNVNTRITQPLKHSSNISIQRLYTLSPFSSKILGKVLRSDIGSLLTLRRRPNQPTPKRLALGSLLLGAS